MEFLQTRSLSNKEGSIHFDRLEVLFEDSECILGIKFLAGKDV
jgi:hypothetical protein